LKIIFREVLSIFGYDKKGYMEVMNFKENYKNVGLSLRSVKM
jgi:hypothetical protein